MTVPLDKVAGVRLHGTERIGFYDSRGLSLRVNERVEVETGEGVAVGRVVIAPGQVIHADLVGELRQVLGAASPDGASGSVAVPGGGASP